MAGHRIGIFRPRIIDNGCIKSRVLGALLRTEYFYLVGHDPGGNWSLPKLAGGGAGSIDRLRVLAGPSFYRQSGNEQPDTTRNLQNLAPQPDGCFTSSCIPPSHFQTSRRSRTLKLRR